MKSDKPYQIYGFLDPRTLEVRYIGATVQTPEIRLRSIRANKRDVGCFPKVQAWIFELQNAGLQPIIKVFEKNTPDGIDAEIRWIAKFRASGAPLFNISAGGYGSRGSIRSVASRAKTGAANKGNKRPDLASRNKLGRKLSDDQVRAIRALAAKGELSMSKIGKLFGTNAVMVHALKHRTKYKDVA